MHDYRACNPAKVMQPCGKSHTLQDSLGQLQQTAKDCCKTGRSPHSSSVAHNPLTPPLLPKSLRRLHFKDKGGKAWSREPGRWPACREACSGWQFPHFPCPSRPPRAPLKAAGSDTAASRSRAPHHAHRQRRRCWSRSAHSQLCSSASSLLLAPWLRTRYSLQRELLALPQLIQHQRLPFHRWAGVKPSFGTSGGHL